MVSIQEQIMKERMQYVTPTRSNFTTEVTLAFWAIKPYFVDELDLNIAVFFFQYFDMLLYAFVQKNPIHSVID